MRPARTLSPMLAILALVATGSPADAQSETSRSVEGGGVTVPGWTGRIDASEAESGLTLEDARLAMDDGALHVTTGPSVSYWNPENVAQGSYTVRATFSEPEYMNLNNHPHPYGLFVGGTEMGTANQSYLYCAAYGNGRFIVRGFGPEPFRVNGDRPEEHEAVARAAGQGEPVTQEIAISVDEDSVDCSINGTVVGSYPLAEVVGEGRLPSTDGVYGIRFGHNTEGLVRDLSLTSN